MAIVPKAPNVIHLAGEIQLDENSMSSEAITPGHLIQRVNSGGALKYRKHATASGYGPAIFALDRSEFNKGVSDAFAVGDIIKAGVATPGATFWALLPSGQNITQGALLESNGDGTLKVASSGVALAQALESVNNSAGPTTARIRVEAL